MLDPSLASLQNQMSYPDLVLFIAVCFFFFEWLAVCFVSMTLGESALFSRADYARKMHRISPSYGLLLTRDSKLFIINLISLRAISSSEAGGPVNKSPNLLICVPESLLFSKVLSVEREEGNPHRFMCFCIYLFIFNFTA